MIEKPKKQFVKFSLLLIAALVLPLVGFFIFATFFNPAFFSYLALGLSISLLYFILLSMRLGKLRAINLLKIQDLEEQKNLVQAAMLEEESAIKSFQDKIISYSQLKGLTESLSQCLYLEDTSKTLSFEINKLLADEDKTIILYLFHSKTGELGISSSQKGQMRINIKSKKGDVFDQWIVKTMQPLLVEDTKSDYRFDMDKIVVEDLRPIRSLISAPLMGGNKALGILRVDSPHENRFGTEDLRFLTTIGDLAAVAIENAQLYEHAEQLAIKDSLTGLYLRNYLLDRLSVEITRHMRDRAQLSFLMIDLDKFKQYNDKFGHMAGDIVLRTVGMILSNHFKDPGTLLCRYGGEEFAVFLPNCPKARAVDLAEQVRQMIAEQMIILRREKTHVTVSIGVATFPKDAASKDELIHKADSALYKAKEEGRNRVCAVSHE